MKGAKLSKVLIISKDGTSKEINLEKLIQTNEVFKLFLKPHDTIHIDQSLGNFLLTKTNVIATLLQLTNVILEATQD